MRTILQAIAVLAVFALVVAGCKKYEATNPVTTVTHASGTYSGVLAGSTTGGADVSGTMTLNIPSAKSVPSDENLFTVFTVTGTFTLSGGAVVNVTGTYNDANDSLYVSSSSGFSFKGTYNHTTGALQGSWTTPNSSGSFVAQGGSGAHGIPGTWTSTAHAGTSGVFNMCVSGNTVMGIISASSASSGSNYRYPFSGTITADDSVKINVTFGALSVKIAQGKFSSSARTSASGTYTLPTVSGHSDAGTWVASN